MLAKNVRELGAVLREARTTQSLTQSELAHQMKVTQSVISKLEKGYPGASIGLIFRILRTLGLAMDIGNAATPGPRYRNLIDLDAIANTGLLPSATKRMGAKRK